MGYVTVPRRVYIYIYKKMNFKHLKRISSPSQPSQGIFENPKSMVLTTLAASNLLMGSNRMCAGGEGRSLISFCLRMDFLGEVGNRKKFTGFPLSKKEIGSSEIQSFLKTLQGTSNSASQKGTSNILVFSTCKKAMFVPGSLPFCYETYLCETMGAKC